MPPTWELLDADADERRRFASLQAALDAASGPAAPPNTHRQVLRIDAAAGPGWYLKVFHRTQLKNQCRSLLSAPRCRLDGAREALVAAALRARGFSVARPVAWGRDGASAFYLCAGLEGRSLQELWLDHSASPALMRAAARHAGRILRAGVRLPDLAFEHLFCDASAPAPQFAVIDLHNGSLARRLPLRLLQRILRRSRKGLSVRPLPRPLALRCALAFLRAAGLPKARRRQLLERLPPYDTHSRYDAGSKSAVYRDRNPARSARELALLRRIWPGQPGDLVLDMPTGAGRLAPLLGELAAQRIGADRSLAMLREARQHGDALFCVDAQRIPFADRSTTGVVVFRFLHHLPRAAARQVVEEACRVADAYVVLSFFHPVSAHGLKRRLKNLWRRRPPTRFALWPRELRAWVEAAGFEPQDWLAEAAYRREFWLLTCRRRSY